MVRVGLSTPTGVVPRYHRKCGAVPETPTVKVADSLAVTVKLVGAGPLMISTGKMVAPTLVMTKLSMV